MATKEKKDIKGKSAFELFPDIMKHLPGSRKGGRGKEASAVAESGGNIPRRDSRIEPPKPPDIAHLLADERVMNRDADATLALVLFNAGRERDVIGGMLEKLGYVVEYCRSQVEAVERIDSSQIGVVILQDGFEANVLGQSLFHRYMKALPMYKRRYIYYALVGPRFHTMYDLQALAESANLVLNTQDVQRFDLILRKGLRQYEELFGPYMEFLQDQGRK